MFVTYITPLEGTEGPSASRLALHTLLSGNYWHTILFLRLIVRFRELPVVLARGWGSNEFFDHGGGQRDQYLMFQFEYYRISRTGHSGPWKRGCGGGGLSRMININQDGIVYQ